MNRPNIFQFDDPIRFLEAYFHLEREGDPQFTVRRWALRMGFHSPKPLLSILRGTRKIKLKDLEFIRKGVDLSFEEAQYMGALVMWKRARADEKPILKFLLSSLQERYGSKSNPAPAKKTDFSSNIFESNDDELFSHWTDAALLSALRLNAAQDNLDLIRKNLLWEEDPAQIDRSLERIRRHRLLGDEEGQSLKPKFEKITTSNHRVHRGAQAYYAQVNKIATQAIDLPLEDREFQCFSMPVRKLDTPEFKHLIREFRDELVKLSTEKGDSVYQFNLEMFPLLTPIHNEQASPSSRLTKEH
jgi:uncharacterized protein (TIGR02147 family)